MTATLGQSFAETIQNGLKRKSITSCAKWAQKFRIVGKPWPGPYSFKYFPWCRELHDIDDPKWICIKGSQTGLTEVCLNRSFYTIDIKRIDVLYLLPSQTPDAGNFSAGRFDPALEMSPYLKNLFGDVSNIGHKRAGGTNLYIRGTRSRSQLKSIPAGLLIFDELDEMTKENLSLAEERQSGQVTPQQIRISTPTIAHEGISFEYENSNQEHFHFKCPCCSRLTELLYPECLVITADDLHDPRINDSKLICKECKGVLNHETKHEWLADGKWYPHAQTSFNGYRGFHLPGLYSSATLRSPANIAIKVMKAREDQHEEQELYNSVLGAVHEVKGARITDDDINKCRRDYTLSSCQGKATYSSLVTMGVDQGPQDIYYEVNVWLPISGMINDQGYNTDINFQYRPRVVDIGIVHAFQDLDKLMRLWQVKGCVIDGHPERRAALEFAYRFPSYVTLCFYAEGVTSRNLNIWANEPSISVDRTAWLDLALGRFKSHSILLPADIPIEYGKHVKTPVRVPGIDKHGNPIARYVTPERSPDHYAHARTYAEIALGFATLQEQNRSIQSPR